MGPLDQPSDIINLQIGWNLALWLPHLYQLIESVIWYNNLGNVWLYSTERVVKGWYWEIREQIETRAFPDIGKADYSHFEFVLDSSPGCFFLSEVLFGHLCFIIFWCFYNENFTDKKPLWNPIKSFQGGSDKPNEELCFDWLKSSLLGEKREKRTDSNSLDSYYLAKLKKYWFHFRGNFYTYEGVPAKGFCYHPNHDHWFARENPNLGLQAF